MPNIEDWEFEIKRFQPTLAPENRDHPRIVFGGQGDWLPTATDGVGRGTVGFRSGGAIITRRNTDTRGFPSGRMRTGMYIGPGAITTSTIQADIDLKFYIQQADGVGGLIYRTTSTVDGYTLQLIGEDTVGNVLAISELFEGSWPAPLTAGEFVGWEVIWESSADPAVDPNPILNVKLLYHLSDDWASPVVIAAACVDFSLPMWENFWSPVVWGLFSQTGTHAIFVTVATPLFVAGALKGFQI